MTLSEETRDCIFKYFMTLLVPTGAVSAVLGGVIGFFGYDIAYTKANQAAYDKAYAGAISSSQQFLTSTISDIAKAKSDAATAAIAATDAARKAGEAEAKVESASETASNGSVAISRTLNEVVDLKSKVTGLNSSDVSKIENLLKAAETGKIAVSDLVASPIGQDGKAASEPYIVGSQTALPLGKHKACIISAIVWQSQGIAQAVECRIVVANGSWTLIGGTRMGCGATCLD